MPPLSSRCIHSTSSFLASISCLPIQASAKKAPYRPTVSLTIISKDQQELWTEIRYSSLMALIRKCLWSRKARSKSSPRKTLKKLELNTSRINQNMVISHAFVAQIQNSKNVAQSPNENGLKNSEKSEQREQGMIDIIWASCSCKQMFDYKARVFLITFSAYVGIHSLRTTYSFSKGMIADTVSVDVSELGIVDSLMLYAVAIGFFQQAIFPFTRTVLPLGIGLIFTAFFFLLVPITLTAFSSGSFAILCVLMSIDGYFQSYAWPNLLMLLNSQYDNKKQALILGAWSTNTNVGNIFGFILGQILVIKAGMDWQISMYIIGSYGIFNSILVFCGLNELPKVEPPPAQNQPLISQQNTEYNQSGSVQPNQLQSITKLLRSPVVILMTITFSLVKSVEYGILLWLPMYFNIIGLVDYSAYIPITFDCAGIVSSIALGYAFKKIENKGLLLGPLIFLLMILFVFLRYINASVSGYYVMITCVGLCLGGSYNTLASLVAMELVKVVDPRYRTKYLGIYSAILMCAANFITATTQILIGYIIGQNQDRIFTIFFWYSAVALLMLITIGILERKESSSQVQEKKETYIQIVGTH